MATIEDLMKQLSSGANAGAILIAPEVITGKTVQETINDFKSQKAIQEEIFTTGGIKDHMDKADLAIKNYIIGKMAQVLAKDTLNNLLETQFDEGWMETEIVFNSDARARGGAFGTFFEDKFLGVGDGKKSNAPTWDMAEIMTEIKVTTISAEGELGRAGITVGNIGAYPKSALTETEAEIQGKILALEKMTMKMTNLLYAELEESQTKTGKSRIRINTLELYTELILKKLEEFVLSTEDGSLVKVTRGDAKGKYDAKSGTYFYNYTVTINFKAFERKKKLLELYARQIDLINMIKGDSHSRKAFFGLVKNHPFMRM